MQWSYKKIKINNFSSLQINRSGYFAGTRLVLATDKCLV